MADIFFQDNGNGCMEEDGMQCDATPGLCKHFGVQRDCKPELIYGHPPLIFWDKFTTHRVLNNLRGGFLSNCRILGERRIS